jgi:hypothetical protein
LEPILYNANTALQMIVTPSKGRLPADLPYWRAWAACNVLPNRCGPCLGLRTFFWTKNYYEIYRLGEEDLGLFNLLMGVGLDPIGFKQQSSMTEDPVTLIRNTKPSLIEPMLQAHALLSIQSGDRTPSIVKPGRLTAPIFRYNVISYQPDDVRLSVNVNQDGVLIFRDGYSKDWTATLDGNPTRLYKADAIFKGVILPAGQHAVEFRYRPLFYLASACIYLLLCLFVPLAALGRRFLS